MNREEHTVDALTVCRYTASDDETTGRTTESRRGTSSWSSRADRREDEEGGLGGFVVEFTVGCKISRGGWQGVSGLLGWYVGLSWIGITLYCFFSYY